MQLCRNSVMAMIPSLRERKLLTFWLLKFAVIRYYCFSRGQKRYLWRLLHWDFLWWESCFYRKTHSVLIDWELWSKKVKKIVQNASGNSQDSLEISCNTCAPTPGSQANPPTHFFNIRLNVIVDKKIYFFENSLLCNLATTALSSKLFFYFLRRTTDCSKFQVIFPIH